MIQGFITDIHIGAPNEISNLHGHDDILLGDIFDFANVKKSKIKDLNYRFNKARTIFGERYVTGNHERCLPIGEFYILTTDKNKVYCTHGDLEANPEKWLNYRKKPHGAGFLKRTFVVPAIELAEELIERPMRLEFLDRAADVAKYNGCNVYVCGHFHVKEVTETMHRGVRIITLPRGRTELDL